MSTRASAPELRAWYSYCPAFHAGNLDEGLGFIRNEMERRGATFAYFRSVREHDFYPHCIHNLDHLFRFGGCAPAIEVRADIRRTLLLGLQWLDEGPSLLVRAGEGIRSMQDLKGRRIGLSKSLNAIKVDWWRATEESGTERLLAQVGMTRRDVRIVDFPYADDWYDDPALLAPLASAADLWRSPDLKRHLSPRPLTAALASGVIDACYIPAAFVPAQQTEARFEVLGDSSPASDGTTPVASSPYALTVDATLAHCRPDLVVAFMKGLIRAGRLGNANRAAAAAILEASAFYPNREVARASIAAIDFVPNLSPGNLRSIKAAKDFLGSRGYIRNDVDVERWAAPSFAEAACRELAAEAGLEAGAPSAPRAASLEEAQRRAISGASVSSVRRG